MTKLAYLNLGCGATFHPNWTNVDFVSTGEDVIAHNLILGIPFSDNKFEVVYHSHVLEHFPKQKAMEFVGECYRVLKPGGIIRVAVPDLEQIAINYLKYLNESVENKPKAKEKYEWMLLELIDQMVRTQSGGEMLKYVADESKQNDEFLLQRCGHEITRLINNVRGTKTRIVENSVKNKIKNTVKKTTELFADKPDFRSSGEVHQWMYDRFSLAELLKSCGFKNINVKTAFESSVPHWSAFKLDGEDGIVRKPDSLFMEGIK